MTREQAIRIGETVGHNEGWDVFQTHGSRAGDGLQVQKDDRSELLRDDLEAEELARAAGLPLDGGGFVVGPDGKRV